MTLLGSSTAYVTPYVATSDDGFPTPNAQQVLDIERQASGRLSNAPPPPTLSQAGITNFQLIAFNENFEVAFFEDIIRNITNNVPGFEYESSTRTKAEMLEILETIKSVSNVLRS
jgi:hypothetical protein